MKLYKYTTLFLMTLLLTTSCADDDVITDFNTGDGNEETPITEGNYYPSTVNDYWNYDVVNTDNITNETLSSTDNIYVDSENGSSFTLGANNNTLANGTMNGLLTSATLSRTTTALLANGNLDLPPAITDLIDFDITLDAIKLYQTNANTGDLLSSNTDTFTQDFNDFPVTITYVLSTSALGNFDSMTLNGDLYSNVVKADLKINLTVETTVTVFGVPLTIAILESQDILSITNYFAKDIGLVRSEADSGYTISPTAILALESAEIDLNGIPTSGSSTNTQELTDYLVAE